MGCRQCQKNHERTLTRRQQLMAAQVDRLKAACSEGDQRSCMALQQMLAMDANRGAGKFRSDLRQRCGHESPVVNAA